MVGQLSETQKAVYKAEKLMNFRLLSKLLARPSSYVLSSDDLVSAELSTELADIGEFAEVAYAASYREPAFVFENLQLLASPNFPLEGYGALLGSVLVESFKGAVADLAAYTAYKPQTKQLVVSISGTSSNLQALYDVRILKHPYRAVPGAQVHDGFWRLYKGIFKPIHESIRKGLAEHPVEELVITGHSLGGAMSSLVAIGLINNTDILQHGLRTKIVSFGAPRSGNKVLVQHYRDTLAKYRAAHGQGSIIDYSVKAYNDGCPALPPQHMGFKHFTQNPIYFISGHFYHVPPTECEYAMFNVTPDDSDNKDEILHPRGGHNYYNSRDLERVFRRMHWMDKMMGKDETQAAEWTDAYLAYVAKREGRAVTSS